MAATMVEIAMFCLLAFSNVGLSVSSATHYESTDVILAPGQLASNNGGTAGVEVDSAPTAAALVSPGPGQCYSCVDCLKVTAATPHKYCSSPNRGGQAGQCVWYAEKYQHTKKLWWVRGCPQELGSCLDIQHSKGKVHGVELVSCLECSGDLCNGSTSARAAILIVLMTPILLKGLMQ